jgi:hypothetical protein
MIIKRKISKSNILKISKYLNVIPFSQNFEQTVRPAVSPTYQRITYAFDSTINLEFPLVISCS